MARLPVKSDKNKNSPAHEAAASGSATTLRLILDQNVPTDVQNQDRNTPLHYFARRFSNANCIEELFNKLLEGGVRVSGQNNRGVTALHNASWRQNLKIVQLLLHAGADPNLQTGVLGIVKGACREGETALHWACRALKINLALITTLFAYGADPTIRSKTGETAYDLALKSGDKALIQMFEDEITLLECVKALGLSEYLPVFKKEKISVHLLPHMDDKMLDSLGITEVGGRLKLANMMNYLPNTFHLEKDTEGRSVPKLVYDNLSLFSTKESPTSTKKTRSIQTSEKDSWIATSVLTPRQKKIRRPYHSAGFEPTNLGSGDFALADQPVSLDDMSLGFTNSNIHFDPTHYSYAKGDESYMTLEKSKKDNQKGVMVAMRLEFCKQQQEKLKKSEEKNKQRTTKIARILTKSSEKSYPEIITASNKRTMSLKKEGRKVKKKLSNRRKKYTSSGRHKPELHFDEGETDLRRSDVDRVTESGSPPDDRRSQLTKSKGYKNIFDSQGARKELVSPKGHTPLYTSVPNDSPNFYALRQPIKPQSDNAVRTKIKTKKESFEGNEPPPENVPQDRHNTQLLPLQLRQPHPDDDYIDGSSSGEYSSASDDDEHLMRLMMLKYKSHKRKTNDPRKDMLRAVQKQSKETVTYSELQELVDNFPNHNPHLELQEQEINEPADLGNYQHSKLKVKTSARQKIKLPLIEELRLSQIPLSKSKTLTQDKMWWEMSKDDVVINTSALLGTGADSVVYKGKWQHTEVAVKQLRIMTKEILRNFKAEIGMMRNLNHPNVIRFFGACSVSPDIFFVLEYAANGDLHHFINHWHINKFNFPSLIATSPTNSPLSSLCGSIIQEHSNKGSEIETSRTEPPWLLRLSFARDIACGMFYLHSHSPPLLHMDLKSLNVLIDAHFTAKIADFGLSKQARRSGNVSIDSFGSVYWSAPELVETNTYSKEADVYAFGMVLWEIVTGEYPLKKEFPSPGALLRAICNGARPSIPTHVTPEYQTLIQCCWNQDPTDRPEFTDIVPTLDDMYSEHLKEQEQLLHEINEDVRKKKLERKTSQQQQQQEEPQQQPQLQPQPQDEPQQQEDDEPQLQAQPQQHTDDSPVISPRKDQVTTPDSTTTRPHPSITLSTGETTVTVLEGDDLTHKSDDKQNQDLSSDSDFGEWGNWKDLSDNSEESSTNTRYSSDDVASRTSSLNRASSKVKLAKKNSRRRRRRETLSSSKPEFYSRTTSEQYSYSSSDSDDYYDQHDLYSLLNIEPPNSKALRRSEGVQHPLNRSLLCADKPQIVLPKGYDMRVYYWLQQLGLLNYYNAFKDLEFGGLLLLDVDDLEARGIVDSSSQNLILGSIQKVNHELDKDLQSSEEKLQNTNPNSNLNPNPNYNNKKTGTANTNNQLNPTVSPGTLYNPTPSTSLSASLLRMHSATLLKSKTQCPQRVMKKGWVLFWIGTRHIIKPGNFTFRFLILLDNDVLQFFKDENSPSVVLEIDLMDVMSVTYLDQKRKRSLGNFHSLQITTPHELYVISCDTETEIANWKKAIDTRVD
eukprot:CAMPEP_0174255318 /NCGR_PEP_ID=MMETSP0439-20130205/4662_1 /TAXON_ID=0 /ORGANISM="Stereomyxa ramosa, Strain Chinc5" /LENGTH=1531 /DNA_ID=CAMNT_0015337449 /DNA_START=182 /DNA_END=4773 /DNA_ORIENTATION=-